VRIIITGGHHSSALPVIKKIKETHPDAEIFWLGHKRSLKGDQNDTLEYKEITALGIPFYDLKAGKVYKTFDLGRLLRVPFGFFQALYLVFKLRPDVILSFGGYLAAPVVVAGWLLGVPSLTHEQTVVTGYANKVISRFVNKILISWPQSSANFPKNKTVLTGIPLRSEIFMATSSNFLFDNELPVVLIIAGKTGSHFINNLVCEGLGSLLSFCNVIHQCGDNSVFNDFEKCEKKYEEIRSQVSGKYYARKFILDDEIGEAFNKSNLVISRSGAHTIAEILVLQKPCILIPISWVSHNEQNENAKIVREAGLAKILNQCDCTPELFLSSIRDSLANISNYYLKGRSVLELFKTNSADLISNETLNTAKKI